MALCDYFEASVLWFQVAFGPAERLFKGAACVFADFAQDHWVGRAEGMLAVDPHPQRETVRALATFDAAIELLHPERDGNAFAVTLLDRGRVASAGSRPVRSRAAGFRAGTPGGASPPPRRARLRRPSKPRRSRAPPRRLRRRRLRARLARSPTEADRLGLEEDKIVTRLGAAECLGPSAVRTR